MEGLFGFITGLAIMWIFVGIIPPEKVVEYSAAIEQCQKDLPRNQTCEIFAKPALINRQ